MFKGKSLLNDLIFKGNPLPTQLENLKRRSQSIHSFRASYVWDRVANAIFFIWTKLVLVLQLLASYVIEDNISQPLFGYHLLHASPEMSQRSITRNSITVSGWSHAITHSGNCQNVAVNSSALASALHWQWCLSNRSMDVLRTPARTSSIQDVRAFN